MPALEDFNDLQPVFAGKTFSWFRAVHRGSGMSCLLKRCSSDYPSPSEYLFLERDFATATRLPDDVVLGPDQFFRYENRPYAVYRDYPGIPLQQYLREQNSLYLDLNAALHVFEEIVRAVGKLHKSKLIHRGLNPSSIFFHPTDRTVRITGLGFSTFIDSEKKEVEVERYENEEWLAYISPEQTGRMSAEVDQRSDFYALGITFFECLTRQVPFPFSDTMGLIHSHIAQEPPAVRSLNPAIPAALAAILHKLIAKNGRDRYQSTRGILADLQKCRALMQAGQLDATFPLGEADIADTFFLPERSFGRDEELAQLLELLEQNAENRPGAVFLAGPSGVGKSTLLQAVKSQIASRPDFYFLTGGYNYSNRNIPLTGITGALSSMVEQILTAPRELMLDWRASLQVAVGNQGRLLTELIPELGLLLGEQPPLSTDVTLEEGENRLKNTLSSFLQALIRPDRRLVLFLEDLHQADGPSLAFLKTLAQQQAGQNFLLIGTYADESLVEGASFTVWLEQFRRDVAVSEIALKPLPIAYLKQVVAETLRSADDTPEEILDIIHAKTKGMPIFILEFLQRAHQSNALFFDETALRWQWDEDAVEHLPIADNVADLMLAKVQQLPAESVEVLQCAACIGLRFDVNTLAELLGRTGDDTAQSLTEALLNGYLVEDVSGLSLQPSSDITPGKAFSFAHDRFHQALYRLLDAPQKQAFHYGVARLQLERLGQWELEKQLFEVANHLHQSLIQVREAGYNEKAIPVLSASGLRAKQSSSYALAFRYLSDADSLVTPEYRVNNASRVFEMELEILECAFLSGDNEKGEAIRERLMESAGNRLDQARVMQVIAMAQMHRSNLPESYRYCREALRLLDIHLPNSPGQHHVLQEIVKTRYALRGKTQEDILALPRMTDPAAQLIEELYFRSLTYAMSASKELFAIISLRNLRLSLRYGLGAFSYSGFNLYGQVLSLGFGQYKKGLEYTELAISVAQKTGTLQAIGGAKFGKAMGGVHILPLAECLREFEEAHELHHQSGNIFYASTATGSITNYLILLGTPLPELRQKAVQYQRYARNANQPDTDEFQSAAIVFIDVLSGAVAKPAETVEQYPNFSDVHTAWYYILQMSAACLLRDTEKGLRIIESAQKIIESVFFHCTYPEYFFYRSLLQAQVYDASDNNRKKQFRKQIAAAVKMMEKRARFSIENYQHKYLILRGILQQIKAAESEALADFENAASLCSDSRYFHYGAIAHELAGRLQQRQKISPSEHLEAARRLFEQWGAHAVCARMVRDYPEVLKNPNMGEGFHAAGASIDFKSVLKASQVLSSEIELSKVLTNLIRITMENAGAQRGYLLVEKAGGWVMEAAGTTDLQGVQTQTGIPVSEGSAELALAVVNYVARTRKAVVLVDATLDQRFSRDPYVVNNKPKSIACYPVVNQGQLIGILYLENNLAAGAFTPDRAEVLGLLSGQAGISLQNAYLYAQMLDLNRAYERFVPKEFLNFLQKESIIDVQLGDHVQQEMTVMFADIRSFTSISEQLSPRDNFQFINDYLGIMEPVIRRYNGFVDKYIGDAIMALFPTGADDALNAAIKMIEQLDAFNKGRKSEIHIGIGLNTGNLILGTVGGQDRMESTVISDAVNIAARIESMTKLYGVSLLISEHTHSRLENQAEYPIRLLDEVVPEGKTAPLAIYEVIAGDSTNVSQRKLACLADFEAARNALLQADYSKAADLYRQIAWENPGDQPARLFLEKAESRLERRMD